MTTVQGTSWIKEAVHKLLFRGKIRVPLLFRTANS